MTTLARRFRDRAEAGRLLAAKLTAYAGRRDVHVVALPRGGVAVGFEIAAALGAPLDVLPVRRLRVPGYEETAMGAVAPGGVRVLNETIVRSHGIADSVIASVAAAEERALDDGLRLYRGGRPPLLVRGRTVLLVDDGLATGATMRAAVAALRAQAPRRIVAAAPIAAASAIAALRGEVDEVVCVAAPIALYGIGLWYEDFAPTTDDEVLDLLARAAGEMRSPAPGPAGERLVKLPVDGVTLEGALGLPDGARGIVLFAHGSASNRHSARNRYVATRLEEAGFGTLRLDLLTVEEQALDERTGRFRFDIPLLGRRVAGAVEWLRRSPDTQELPVGCFGASTGAAAALVAAAEHTGVVAAVVSRGGRPDLAGPALPRVDAPTLLIVGGNDLPVIAINRAAAAQLRVEHRIEIVPSATHLFEEAGAIATVAELSKEWFIRHLRG